MKRVLIAAISLCIVAATAAPVSAFAAQRSSAPSYPDIYDDPLTFTALSDYAVAGDGKYVFAQDKEILFLKNEDLTSYSFDVKVEAVDCSEGVFYYTLQGDGKVYSLPDQAESQYTMPDFTKEITDDSDPNLQYYYNTGSGTLTLLDKSKDTNEALTELTGCTRIKKYGGTLYVIKENSLCTLNGAEASKVSLTYSNYGELETIPVGDAPEKLNTYSTYGQHCKVVTIGSHDKVTATAIDLNELSDSANGTFLVSDPRASTTELDAGSTALLLYESQNLLIISIGSQCYILNPSDAPASVEIVPEEVQSGTTATLNAESGIYALPYMSASTKSANISAGTSVTVLYSLTIEKNPPLAHNFYIVRTADGSLGYVAENFLNNFSYPPFDEGGTATIQDPNPSYDDYVKTVVLILVIVALALIAVGYTTWLLTSGKRKKLKESGVSDATDEADEKKQPDDGSPE